MDKPYQKYTTGSPFFIKRFSHHKRFEKVLSICKKLNTKTLLDIGTGDAYFLKLVYLSSLKLELIHGLEPAAEYHNEARNMISDLKNFELYTDWKDINQQYDVITCQEVLEHLLDDDIFFMLTKIKEHLKPSGYLIVSVPIETGLAGFVKNIIRMVIGAKHRNTSLLTIIKSAFGMPINRVVNKNGFISSHLGFNHKLIEQVLKKAKFDLIKSTYSPFPNNGIFNTQKIYLLQSLQARIYSSKH